jgi:hypothetical protein
MFGYMIAMFGVWAFFLIIIGFCIYIVVSP